MKEEVLTVRVIRSRRKTMSMQLKGDGLIVRAPLWAKDRQIREFIEKNRAWIEKQQEKLRAREEETPDIQRLTMEEIRDLADRASAYIPERVRYFAPLVGVTYGRITIRNQKTRWGSCSQKGNLNFNCLLMLTPPEVIDSVVVHELCHRLELNHSKRFYDEVYRVMPDYSRWDRWLKQNGGAIMRRMTG